MFDVLGAADMMSVALEVASTVNSVVDHAVPMSETGMRCRSPKEE